jgi:hypothetical protein
MTHTTTPPTTPSAKEIFLDLVEFLPNYDRPVFSSPLLGDALIVLHEGNLILITHSETLQRTPDELVVSKVTPDRMGRYSGTETLETIRPQEEGLYMVDVMERLGAYL